MLLLPPILANSTRPPQLFTLLQSSAAQSTIPILQDLIAQARGNILLVCYLYPPKIFTNSRGQQQIEVVDCTAHIPHYHDEPDAWEENVLTSLHKIDSSLPLTVVIDSIETLLSNASNSVAKVYPFLSKVLASVQTHKGPSRLIVHGTTSSTLTSLLCQPSFSSTLTHIISHPPVLLRHLALSYSTPPPPLTAPERFWNVFSPIADREHESENLVFGADGEGYGGDEIVVELIMRSIGEGGRRGVERALEGWITQGDFAGPCDLRSLPSLSSVWTRKIVVDQAAPDPTTNASFNLSLTPEQQQARAQVPLPYAHNGGPVIVPDGSILYDPDSADDLDDDDPDEDLDF
ncbi:hypothetical protein BC835DRAFT_1261803 [Cytidiella melzeri]|nr:hypothetical protein BC835DRAFT_1261803 [Cytidiella melzeri]